MKRSGSAAFLTLIFVLALGGILFAEDFTAEVAGFADGKSFSGRIFVSNNRIRMETPGAVTITQADKDVAWVLMPQQNLYVEQPIDRKTVIAATGKVPDAVSRKFIEDEIVNGRNTKKYRVVCRIRGNQTEIFQWIDPSIALPVKTAAVDGSWSMEYKNIMTGEQDGSGFEIPAGYRRSILSMNNFMEYRETQSAGDEEDSEEILSQ